MGRLIVEQIVSADGYAADAEGGIGFFENARGINEADREQLRLLGSVHAIVLGRRTFEMFAAYWPHADPAQEPVAVPLNAIPRYVVSNTLQRAPWGDGEIDILRGDGVASMRALRRRVDGDVIVWGSLTLADALLRASEVDVLRLRVVPRLIGTGRSFAPADLGQRDLSLRQATAYPSGLQVVQYAFAP